MDEKSPKLISLKDSLGHAEIYVQPVYRDFLAPGKVKEFKTYFTFLLPAKPGRYKVKYFFALENFNKTLQDPGTDWITIVDNIPIDKL